MKLENKRTRSRLYWAGAVLLTYLFLLLLSQGFVTSGDDWYFSARDTGEGLIGAFKAATHNAYRHYLSLNGRLLGNGFSRFFGTHDTFRELTRCAIILVILLQLVRTAKITGPLMYMIALMLTIALPADIYAQSYAWAAGFFNYVPPLMMILAYIFWAINSLPTLIFCRPLIGLYSSLSQETADLAFRLIWIHNGLGILFWPLSFTLPNALRAANDVQFTMRVGIASMVVVRIGLSWILCVVLGWGATGVWIAMVADWLVRIAFLLPRVLSGKWKKLCGLA